MGHGFNSADFSRLNTSGWGTPILVFPSLESTNSTIRSMRNPAHGLVVLADTQTGGRGRSGRQWVDESGKNLLFSVSITLQADDPKTATAPLLTALGVCNVLKKRGYPVSVKWPNDILAGSAKLAGILVEGRTTGSSIQLTLGVGINVNQTHFPDLGTIRAASLKQLTGTDQPREHLLADILTELETVFTAGDMHSLLDQYRTSCGTIGRSISFESDGQTRQGIATGVDDTGRLMVVENGQTIAYYGNEIIHIRSLE